MLSAWNHINNICKRGFACVWVDCVLKNAQNHFYVCRQIVLFARFLTIWSILCALHTHTEKCMPFAKMHTQWWWIHELLVKQSRSKTESASNEKKNAKSGMTIKGTYTLRLLKNDKNGISTLTWSGSPPLLIFTWDFEQFVSIDRDFRKLEPTKKRANVINFKFKIKCPTLGFNLRSFLLRSLCFTLSVSLEMLLYTLFVQHLL